MNLYKALWARIGGRKWSFIRRDFWHRSEIINIVFFVSIGFFSGLFYPVVFYWLKSAWWHPIVLAAAFYFIGVIQGHFFWGTKWIEGQKE